jgi:apolipoprotein N-acyltransferase
MRFAALRAIENRRSIARAANTGISCFITPYGTIFNETPEGVITSTTATIELRDDLTLYARWGDWVPHLCLAISALMGGYAVSRRLVRREKFVETGVSNRG